MKYQDIGLIHEPSDYLRYGKTLAPAYAAQRWTWGGYGYPRVFPGALEIADCIQMCHRDAQSYGSCSTGGIKVVRLDNGECQLQADERLCCVIAVALKKLAEKE